MSLKSRNEVNNLGDDVTSVPSWTSNPAVIQAAHLATEQLHAEQGEDEDGEADDKAEVAQVQNREVDDIQE